MMPLRWGRREAERRRGRFEMRGGELIEHDRPQMARLGRTRRTVEAPSALERWMHAGTGSASPRAGQAEYRRTGPVSQATGD